MAITQTNPPDWPKARWTDARETSRPPEDMTLRDYFAGQALAGLIGAPGNENTAEQDARTAYEWADAMLQARKDTQ